MTPETTRQRNRLWIPLTFVGVHTMLVLGAFGIGVVSWGNDHYVDDSSPAYLFCIFVYVIDLPVSLLIEALRSVLPELEMTQMHIAVGLGLFLCLGGFMWYCLGLATTWLVRTLWGPPRQDLR